MRVGIAHEWLVRYAGSERCVEQMLAEFPDSVLLTTVLRPDGVPESLRGARPSFLQRMPGATSHHEWLLPLMPLAWRLRRPLADVDVVISSSHACAKAVRARPGTPHLCYCHTPMRYAWDFEAERERFPPGVRPFARRGMAWFRAWDRRTARRITRFVANSRAVAERIRRFYGRDADVVHPPVRTDYFTPEGERGEDFLYVGRLVSYKRADLTIAAFGGLPQRLLVVGEGHLRPQLESAAPPNVEFLGEVEAPELRQLYRRARALVYPANEDFGIAMAEAQACGTPVISLDEGGARDIVEHGVTGWLLADASLDALRDALRRAAQERLDEQQIRERAERFSHLRFRREIRAAVEEMLAQRPR